MIGLALVLSLSGLLAAILWGVVAFVVAWVVCAILAHGGIPTPRWVPAVIGVLVFLIVLLDGATVN